MNVNVLFVFFNKFNMCNLHAYLSIRQIYQRSRKKGNSVSKLLLPICERTGLHLLKRESYCRSMVSKPSTSPSVRLLKNHNTKSHVNPIKERICGLYTKTLCAWYCPSSKRITINIQQEIYILKNVKEKSARQDPTWFNSTHCHKKNIIKHFPLIPQN